MSTTSIRLVTDDPTFAAPLGVDLRADLRAEIARRDAVAARRDKAKDALERAEALLAETVKALDDLAGLDSKLAESRAAAIHASLSDGATLDLNTPAELASMTIKRAELENRRVAIESAARKLEDDLDQAEAAWRAADQAVRRAALPIIVSEAEAMARELLSLEADAAGLRRRLAGYRSMRLNLIGIENNSAYEQFLPLDNTLRTSLIKPPSNTRIESDGPSFQIVREVFTSLVNDADAPLDRLRP